MLPKNPASIKENTSEKQGFLPGASAIASAIRNSAKALVVVGSLASASCATLGYGEIALVSQQCGVPGSPDDCQNSLDQIIEKGIDPELDSEQIIKYSVNLKRNLERMEKELLADIAAQKKSLRVVEKYDAPDWDTRLRKSLDEDELKIIIKLASGILESSEDEESALQRRLTPKGVEKLKIIARLSKKVANLKLAYLAVKTKYGDLFG